MKFNKEVLENSKVKFSVEVTPEEFEVAVEEAYRTNKNKFPAIGGFRKGKAPRKVIEMNYGKGVFYEDAIDLLLPKYYSEILAEDTSVEPVASPSVSDLNITDEIGLNFVLEVAVKPEVKLGQYKDLEVKATKVKVTAKQVDEAIAEAREKAGRMVVVEDDRACANGDTVTIDFSGSVDGVKFDGGSAEKFDLELGSKTFIPGFEDQVVGMKKDEEKDVVVTFPAEYGAENLAGKEAVFAVKLHSIKVKELPALDDEFAKDVSEYDTLAEYKKSVKVELTKKAEEKAVSENEQSLIEAITANVEVAIPEEMVDNQCEQAVQEFAYRLQYKGMNLDDYLKFAKLTKDDLKAQYKDNAAKQVKTMLTLEAILKAENIVVTDEDIEARVASFAEHAKQDVVEYRAKMSKEQLAYITNELEMAKLFDFLKNNNKFI